MAFLVLDNAFLSELQWSWNFTEALKMPGLLIHTPAGCVRIAQHFGARLLRATNAFRIMADLKLGFSYLWMAPFGRKAYLYQSIFICVICIIIIWPNFLFLPRGKEGPTQPLKPKRWTGRHRSLSKELSMLHKPREETCFQTSNLYSFIV